MDHFDKLVNTKEASSLTGMSIAWFERKRWLKEGPPLYKVGSRSIRYKVKELFEWFDLNREGVLS